jgi:hypothetical protein
MRSLAVPGRRSALSVPCTARRIRSSSLVPLQAELNEAKAVDGGWVVQVGSHRGANLLGPGWGSDRPRHLEAGVEEPEDDVLPDEPRGSRNERMLQVDHGGVSGDGGSRNGELRPGSRGLEEGTTGEAPP